MYETLSLETKADDVKVPEGTGALAKHILGRFYVPDNVRVPDYEINSNGRRGTFRKPEFCYGSPACNPEDGVGIIGSYAPLDHIMELHAQYEISRVHGRDLIKLMVAKRLVIGEHEHHASDETGTMLDSINTALGDYARVGEDR